MSMSKRKFYKTTIKVEVLSEEPIPDTLSLGEIETEAIDGEYSYRWVRTKEEQLNGKQAAKALIKQDSDPGFFTLTDEGADIVEQDACPHCGSGLFNEKGDCEKCGL